MEIKIENFKSIKKIEFELSNINVLIGPTNSGKSNLLESIFLYGYPLRTKIWIEEGRSYKYDDTKIIRSNPKFWFRDFDDKNRIRMESDKYGPLEISLENNTLLFNNQKDPAVLEEDFPLTLLYRYESFVEKKYTNESFNRFLLPDFSNLNKILIEKYPNVFKTISDVWNDLFNISFGYLSEMFLKIVIDDLNIHPTLHIPIERLYETAQTIQYFILFSSAVLIGEEVSRDIEEDVVIMLEEPDAHTFPIVIEEFMEILKKVDRCKVILTTHNPYTIIHLVDKIDNLNIFAISRDDEGYTGVFEIDNSKIREKIEEIGITIIRNLEIILKDIVKNK